MVGKKTKINWYNITKKFNNVKFKLGSWNKHQGLDELTYTLLFKEALGCNINNLKNLNVSKLRTENERNKYTFEVIKQNFEKTNKLKKGNIIGLQKDDELLIGIHIGNNKILSMTEDYNVKVLKLNKKYIIGVYK